MFGNRSEMLDVYRQQAFVNVFTQFAVSGEFVDDGLESHQVADQFALGRGHAHAPGHRNENFAQQPLKFIFFFSNLISCETGASQFHWKVPLQLPMNEQTQCERNCSC